MSGLGTILYVGAVLPKRSETFVYREVLGLRERGVDVAIASVRPPEEGLVGDAVTALADEAVPVYGSGLGGLLRLIYDANTQTLVRIPRGLHETGPSYWFKHLLQCEGGYALAKRVRDRSIMHVHAHMAHVPTTIAMHCAEALGVPFSFTGHAADLFRDRSALKTKLKRAAFVACISHWHRDFYHQIVPRDDSAYPVIRCGVDVDQFRPEPGQARKGLLAVGRLVRKKGFDLLIDAVAACGAAPDLTIVGDGPERGALQQQIDRLGLSDRIRLAGSKPNHEIVGLMRQAEAFVLPCRVAEDGDRDGIPVVLMEAMATGLAVISGDLPTIRELVDHERTGLMVAPGRIDALAQAMTRLSSDTALEKRLAAAGRERVIEEFSMSVNLDRLTSAFERSSSAARPGEDAVSTQPAAPVKAVEG